MKLILSKSFNSDTRQILSYTSSHFGGYKADQLIRYLDSKIDQISASPNLFPKVYQRRNIRKVIFTHFPYILFYKVQNDEITILRLLHAHQNVTPTKLATP